VALGVAADQDLLMERLAEPRESLQTLVDRRNALPLACSRGAATSMGYLTDFYRDSHQKELKK